MLALRLVLEVPRDATKVNQSLLPATLGTPSINGPLFGRFGKNYKRLQDYLGGVSGSPECFWGSDAGDQKIET